MSLQKIENMNKEEIKDFIKLNPSILYELIDAKNQKPEIWDKLISAEPKILNMMHPKLLQPLLHYAMKNHAYDTVNYLLNYGEQLEYVNGETFYNYHFLTEIDKYTDIETYKKIYDKYQKINKVDIKTIISNTGDNLLSNAITNINFEIAKFYKDLGIDPNQETQDKHALFVLVATNLIEKRYDKNYQDFIEKTVCLFNKNEIDFDKKDMDEHNVFQKAWEENPLFIYYMKKHQFEIFKEQMQCIQDLLKRNKRITYLYLITQENEVLDYLKEDINWNFSRNGEDLLDFFAKAFYANPQAFPYILKKIPDCFVTVAQQTKILDIFLNDMKEYSREDVEKYIMPEFDLIINNIEVLGNILGNIKDKKNTDFINCLEMKYITLQREKLNDVFVSNEDTKSHSKKHNRI